MGQLVNGKWDPEANQGGAGIRHWLTQDGSPGPDGQKGFPAEKGRYALYVAHGCPFAHRTVLIRKLKKLEDAIPLYVTSPTVPQRTGWNFDTKVAGTTGDPVNHFKTLSELYIQTDPNYTGRVTVPVLYDTKDKVIVNNESSDIVEMLNTAFNHLGADPYDYVPESDHEHINQLTGEMVGNISGSLYRALFTKDQATFDEYQARIFDSLQSLDKELAQQRYIAGPKITAADIYLFVILVRAPIQLPFARLIYRRPQDYPNLWNYAKDLYQSGFGETVNWEHIVALIFAGHDYDAAGIIPRAPEIDLLSAHNRAELEYEVKDSAQIHRNKYI
ncbi:Glutathionyl-hydroquinone reductase YqjG [Wickerhamiella sorbophila]|uniref:Glutathionyl-hydroquinone reductase YqjG n=1 Tax=Wickerhamiella sorbophila TaxID=45607 RepID=A0A2T0FHX8_9ASCO|nr:Glutathionyl-hydroquinone reductase YqjG [Wickerhamiella sorbophila]PRT54549.1 Glutathionyl-hydroquinone reductase YqjG [Wickerhamiella sorbophila]